MSRAGLLPLALWALGSAAWASDGRAPVQRLSGAVVAPQGVADPMGLDAEPDPRLGGFRPWLAQALAAHHAAEAADARADAAQARADGARGVFDLELVARGQVQPIGKYLEPQVALGLEQATPWWGLRMRGGWRNGADYPEYKGGEITGTAGEAFFDATLPLVRDRAIDARRARILSADVRRDAEALRARMRRLEIAQSAGLAWWNRGLRAAEVCVASRLVTLAEARVAQVGARVTAGERPRIDGVDASRLLLSRQARLEASRARLLAAEAEVAMHAGGDPTARASRGPESPEAGCAAVQHAGEEVERDAAALLEEARRHRPDLALYAVTEAGLQVDLARAENLAVPKVDARLWARGDLGDPRVIGPDALSVMKAEVGVGVEFGLPLQRREALGELAAVKADLRALAAERSWAEAQVAATLAGLVAERDAARTRARLAREAYGAAVALERAEGQAFLLGQSTLVVLNLREEATAEAGLSVAEARIAAAVAVTRLEAAIGRLAN